MAKTYNTRIKNKRDTSANWTTHNPVLLDGEIILVDTAEGELRAKIGDGVKTYTQLPFTDEGIKNLINEKADKSHIHSEYATTSHNHDDRYYTETELEELLSEVAYINSTDNETITDTEISASDITVDPYLSAISTNPVQNKVITAEFNSLSEEIANYKNYVTPQMYGAIGDGVTDDTEAIQRSIDENKTIFFPEGIYKVTGAIKVYANTHLVGVGSKDSTKVNEGASIIKHEPTTKQNLFELSLDKFPNTPYVYDVIIEGLALQGSTMSQVGIYAQLFGRGVIRNVMAKKFDIGILVETGMTATIDNCVLEGNREYGLLFKNNCYENSIGTTTTSFVVSNTYIGQTYYRDGVGVEAYETAVPIRVASYAVTDITFNNCVVESTQKAISLGIGINTVFNNLYIENVPDALGSNSGTSRVGDNFAIEIGALYSDETEKHSVYGKTLFVGGRLCCSLYDETDDNAIIWVRKTDATTFNGVNFLGAKQAVAFDNADTFGARVFLLGCNGSSLVDGWGEANNIIGCCLPGTPTYMTLRELRLQRGCRVTDMYYRSPYDFAISNPNGQIFVIDSANTAHFGEDAYVVYKPNLKNAFCYGFGEQSNRYEFNANQMATWSMVDIDGKMNNLFTQDASNNIIGCFPKLISVSEQTQTISSAWGLAIDKDTKRLVVETPYGFYDANGNLLYNKG